MAVNTAQDIINNARDLAQQWDLAIIPDGWASDVGQYAPGMTAVRSLNMRIRDLNRTGYNQCFFNVPLISGTETYLLTRFAGKIRRSSVVEISTGYEYPLQRTSLELLDNKFFGWKRVRAHRPTHYYFIGTKAFGIYPIVNNALYRISFMADSHVSAVTSPTDIIGTLVDSDDVVIVDSDGLAASSLPENYTDTLSYGVAADMAAAAKDWPTYGRLNKLYKQGWDLLVADVMSRESPDTDLFEIDVSGRADMSQLGIRF